jgi:hypothetical protein
MPDRLRVATLNIWGRHGDWAKRRVVLRRGFEALQPDLLALQETVVTSEYDQVVDLLGTDLHVIHQGQRAEDGTGCSIVSRWAPNRVTEIDLVVTSRVDPADFVGRSTAAEFETPVGTVLFVNHKPAGACTWSTSGSCRQWLQPRQLRNSLTVEISTSCWPETSMLDPRRAAFGSGPGASPWERSASATRTRGSCIVATSRDTRSRSTTR